MRTELSYLTSCGASYTGLGPCQWTLNTTLESVHFLLWAVCALSSEQNTLQCTHYSASYVTEPDTCLWYAFLASYCLPSISPSWCFMNEKMQKK